MHLQDHTAPHCCPNTCGIIEGDALARGSTPLHNILSSSSRHTAAHSQQSHTNVDGCSLVVVLMHSFPFSPVYSLPPPSSSSQPLLSPHTPPSSPPPTLSISLAPSLSLGTGHLPNLLPKLGALNEIQDSPRFGIYMYRSRSSSPLLPSLSLPSSSVLFSALAVFLYPL